MSEVIVLKRITIQNIKLKDSFVRWRCIWLPIWMRVMARAAVTVADRCATNKNVQLYLATASIACKISEKCVRIFCLIKLRCDP